jgi:signal transduction histidine kinase/CheY-like chemotaxis protein
MLNRSLDYEARIREVERLAVPRLADECRVEIAREDETYDREPAIFDGTLMIVPMIHNDRILGTLTFVNSESGRQFTTAGLPLATEFARRAAIAIENAHLYQLAQHANRAKDEFLATLSHELRTPLTAILGWARMLTLSSPLDPETMRVAHETIERSARAQAALIDDLLDLSRIVTGKLTLRSDPVDLVKVVEGAVQTLSLAADAKGIQLEISLPRDPSVVWGDATRLQQIVWNLLSNAIKFSESGGLVSVSMTRSADTGQIVVNDTGRGISPEFLPHVFEPFRQADGATTRVHGGLGLGLAVVKYLTELHGGSVNASSPGEGNGATFAVTLPLALRRAVHETETQMEAIDLRGTSVLVVDDDSDSRELVTAILRRFGAEVRTASSVRGACDVMLESAPHIVVSDIAMPNEDGLSLLRHVKGDVPVVALTAVADSDAPDRLRNAGFRAYLRKPVDPVHFARVIAGLR